jgi:hypothetical protein
MTLNRRLCGFHLNGIPRVGLVVASVLIPKLAGFEFGR